MASTWQVNMASPGWQGKWTFGQNLPILVKLSDLLSESRFCKVAELCLVVPSLYQILRQVVPTRQVDSPF